MKIRRLLKRDLYLGGYYNYIAFVIPIILAIVQGNECHKLISYMSTSELISNKGTILDYYLYGTQGMYVFHFDPKNYFTIPIYWFVFQICISYIIGYYPYQDFIQNGNNLFIKLKDRYNWWRSKCLWCICSIILYYVIYLITTSLTAFLYGAEWNIHFTPEFVTRVFDSQMSNMLIRDIINVSLIVPCVVTIGVCLVQILAGFLISPVMSFSCVCGMYVISAYYTEWFLIGNYTMWLRTKLLTSDGINPASGIILGFILTLCAWNFGEYYFSKKDLF